MTSPPLPLYLHAIGALIFWSVVCWTAGPSRAPPEPPAWPTTARPAPPGVRRAAVSDSSADAPARVPPDAAAMAAAARRRREVTAEAMRYKVEHQGERLDYYVEVADSSENVLPSGFPTAKFALDLTKKYDTCAVGAGLSGTVFAERSAEVLGHRVLVIDSRPHIGGNCYDYPDAQTGILRNQYGSHLFHTKMEHVWDYVTSHPQAPGWKRWHHYKFGEIQRGNATLYVPIPPNILTVNRLLDLDLRTPEDMEAWLKTVQVPCPEETGCTNAEQMAKSRVGDELYKLIFEGYTIKQWDKHPRELDAGVTARIPVVASFDPRYFSDKWQALPGDGYTAWFAAYLDHPAIDVVLATDFFDHKAHLEAACRRIIYTGPIDRYFEQAGMEKLEYRGIKFTEERHYNHPGYLLPTPVLNYPGMETKYTRAIEYKQYLHRTSPHTLVVREESYAAGSDGDPYYPVPNQRNRDLYEKYQQLAETLERTGRIQFVGRLANYKYFNMDQAIDNALTMFNKTSPHSESQRSTPSQASTEEAHPTEERPKEEDGRSATRRRQQSMEPERPDASHSVATAQRKAKAFMSREFQAYKTAIDEAMEKARRPLTEERKQCASDVLVAAGSAPGDTAVLWTGEFGMELRAMVPWAHHIATVCDGVATRGVAGTKYVYYFSSDHAVDPAAARAPRLLPAGNPFKSGHVHMNNIPSQGWKPPPFQEFFRRTEFEALLRDKPLVVILNKYTVEWDDAPVNYFSVPTLTAALDYLTPKYTVLYKRHTSKVHRDDHGQELDLAEKGIIRERFPEVLFFEDFATALDDPVEESNLLLFGFMAQAKRFLTVQGGTAVQGSYFGGTNVILIKHGHEIRKLTWTKEDAQNPWYGKGGDYQYFHKFANTTVIQTETDDAFLREMKKSM